ncbi:MAG: molybdate ABC transporter substrate-binding protein, partial [Fibrobacter sp.]|nr:molybdate ABC transporter substrate-binding protein [Fibrobacter sp.]
VAANMRFAFTEIHKKFTSQTGFSVLPVYGSSGKLVTQIRNGAPFDIFISADVGFADSICNSKLNSTEPRIYAYGKLVLWTLKSYDLSKGIFLLNDSTIKTIAIGDLKLTSYGPAAKGILKTANLWYSLTSKMIFGENITRVAQFIASGSADIGFSAKSLVLSEEMRNKGKWVDIDSSLYEPIPQAALILTNGEKHDTAAVHALYNFIYSKESRNILVRYGYGVP